MFKLQNIYVQHVAMNLDAIPGAGLEFSYEVGHRYNYRIRPTESQIDAVLYVRIQGRAGESPMVTMDLGFQAQYGYDGTEGLSPENFAREHALAWFYPFVRELVANLTSRLPCPPMLLPSIDVVSIAKQFESVHDASLPFVART